MSFLRDITFKIGVAPVRRYMAQMLKLIEAGKREAGDSPVILFNLSGHGHFDRGAYEAYLAGKLEDFAYPADKVKEALASLPRIG
jgi:predicted RNase H-like nuclease